MVSLAVVLVVFSRTTSEQGFIRLQGSYSGPMEYHDDFDGKDKSFNVEVTISYEAEKSAAQWAWTFHYAPPQSSSSSLTSSVLQGGKVWQEASESEKLFFQLKNWDKFCTGTSDWFEIDRPVKEKKPGGGNGLFRRRYTLTKEGLVSEKWLKFPGGDWYRSHKMTLKRVGVTDGASTTSGQRHQ